MAQEKKKALGRGLGALIPQRPAAAIPVSSGDGGAMRVAISDVHANPGQPRQKFDSATIEELSVSIREQGLLQPLLVRKRPAGGYEVIAGERRLRAAKLAGLTEVPVLVRNAGERETLELALVENLQREDLNPIELAQGYEALLQDHGYTQEQLAKRLGRDRATVANTLRLLQLPPEIREDLIAGRLTAGHAKALLSIDGAKERLALRDAILKEGLSVRGAEDRARDASARGDEEGPSKKKKKKHLDPDVAHLIQRLEKKLGLKVEINHSKSGSGRLSIRYSSLDSLQPVLDKLES